MDACSMPPDPEADDGAISASLNVSPAMSMSAVITKDSLQSWMDSLMSTGSSLVAI
jgi:hypothetical protein